MSDFPSLDKLSSDERAMFKRCIRKLLDVTFIVGDRDEKLYRFMASESMRYEVDNYLSWIGYQTRINEQLRVVMLIPGEEDADESGYKRSNLLRFDKEQVRLLLVLWLLYLERMGHKEPVYVTVGDILDRCQSYRMTLKPSDFKKAYTLFKRYQLINFSGRDINEDTAVELYPSLTFCMDIEQFRAVAKEYQSDENEDEVDDAVITMEDDD